jgi:hypothetical protein
MSSRFHPTTRKDALVPTATDNSLAIAGRVERTNVVLVSNQHVAWGERDVQGSEGGRERPDVNQFVLAGGDDVAYARISKSVRL